MENRYLPEPKYLNYEEREEFLRNFLKNAPDIISVGCGIDDLCSINNLRDIHKLEDKRDENDNF